MIQLFDWQVEAEQRQFELLRDRGLAFNACQMGYGKTFMAAVSAKRLGLPVLVICPKSVVTNWYRVLDMAGVTIAGVFNWERLKAGRSGWWNKEKQLWEFPLKVLVIVDEVHRGCTGEASQCTEMLAKLKAYPVPKLLMSATIACTPLAMRGTGFLAGLHNWKIREFHQWCLDCGCVWIKYPSPRGPVYALELPRRGGDRIMAAIHKGLAPYLVNIRDDIPDFPETVVTAKLYDAENSGVAAEVRKEYEALADTIKDRSIDPRAINTRARQRSEIAKVPILADLAIETAESGNSVVVFMNFRDSMNLLEAKIGSANCVQFHGDTKNRQEVIDRFQENRTHIFIAQIQAGGIGVNLHDELKVRPRHTYICPSYKADDMVQCMGRVHRANGTKSFQQFVLLADTPEEKVYDAILRKKGNIAALTTGEWMGLS